jgi:hypothetical protein
MRRKGRTQTCGGIEAIETMGHVAARIFHNLSWCESRAKPSPKIDAWAKRRGHFRFPIARCGLDLAALGGSVCTKETASQERLRNPQIGSSES